MTAGSITVYVDGSGGARPELGGCAYVAYQNGEFLEEGALRLTRATNQMAEILAAAYALHSLPESSLVTLVSDSEYVVKGWNEWLPRWRQRNWRTSTGRHVKNVAHWRRLLTAAERHQSVIFTWTRGHNGTEGNERADVLAGKARRGELGERFRAGKREGQNDS